MLTDVFIDTSGVVTGIIFVSGIFKTYKIITNNFKIIAKTIKGKGISYMENQAGWHGKAPNQEQYLEAVKELK